MIDHGHTTDAPWPGTLGNKETTNDPENKIRDVFDEADIHKDPEDHVKYYPGNMPGKDDDVEVDPVDVHVNPLKPVAFSIE